MIRIAIIGSGPTGIYTAKYLTEKCRGVSITIFEKQSVAGKGMPYNPKWNDEAMLANIASIEIPAIEETLEDWLQKQSDEELNALGIAREDINERAFFPRVALGKYFQNQLYKIKEKKIEGNSLVIKTKCEVKDVKVLDSSIELALTNDGCVTKELFDTVIMATGHTWPKETETKPGYFSSPWPASALKTIKDCHVGIRGTSLSAIDAIVALATARGSFQRNEKDVLEYLSEPGTEEFFATMISRKGLLPEADFYHPIPYEPLKVCTEEAIDKLIIEGSDNLLNKAFALFKAELIDCDPGYSKKINLPDLTLENFNEAYFNERSQHDPFEWAKKNLAEARENQEKKYTVAWRYAILRMHEVIGHVVPHLTAEDYKRFGEFKQIFVDDYATVPHESIERLLALSKAKKIDIIKTGEDYELDTDNVKSAAVLKLNNKEIIFGAFIEAMGQRTLSLKNFPFPSLLEQGIVKGASVPYKSGKNAKLMKIEGIALDEIYHPTGSEQASNLYCLSIPFIMGLYPFAQGINSSHDMGKAVAEDIAENLQFANSCDNKLNYG